MKMMEKQELLERRIEERVPYEMPAIIYEGQITTRAGSPLSGGESDTDGGVDPADLFGNG